MAKIPVQARPKDSVIPAAFNTWNANGDGFALAMSEMNRGLQEAMPVQRAEAYRMSFRNIQPNTSVRTGFNRGDYNYFRPDEAIPTRYKDILYICQTVYQNIPIVKQIIDLMSDFATKGVCVVHQNPDIQKYYEKWWDKVQGKAVSERIANILLRLGVSYIHRYCLKITERQEDKFYRAMAEPNMDYIAPDPVAKGEIPGKYVLYDPLTVENVGGALSKFAGESSYSLILPQELKTQITHPKPEEQNLADKVPKDIKEAVLKGQKYILPIDKMVVMHYKKDEWAEWAHPMIYPILKDIIIMEKLKLADQAALDGVISKVRVWKLGSLDHHIVPGPDAIAKFSEFLLNNTAGGTVDIVWGPAVDLLESDVGMTGVLGEDKYKPILASIYSGLGVPPTLTGMDAKGGFTNNAISLKTLIERLQYIRDLLTGFWTNEIEIVRKAKGFRYPGVLQFDQTILTDENAHDKLLIELCDRNIISEERLREIFNQNPDVERKRVMREQRDRDAGRIPVKSGPYFNSNNLADLKKMALQTGQATPSEVGLELDEKKPGEVKMLDKQHALEKFKVKNAPAPAGFPASKKPKKAPGQGRPSGSKDSTVRKKRVAKPIRGKASVSTWAVQAHKQISDIIVPLVLQMKGKANARQFDSIEFNQVEQLKFALLASLNPFEEVAKDKLISNLDIPIPEELMEMLNKYADVFREDLGRDPNTDELRSLMALSYSKWVMNMEIEVDS